MASKPEHSISDQPAPFNPTVDPFAYLGMVFNSDGSITREHGFLNTPGTSDPSLPSQVLTKDLSLNQSNNTWLRIYIPHKALDSTPFPKLPLIVYYHGGGFIIGSAASPVYHDFCTIMTVEITAIVLSVDYRLAPEHRLPAAYHDSVEALHWIKTTNDEWLAKFADFSNCYLMGASAGANIAYHAATFLDGEDLAPLKIKGLILHQPYFGGTKRTQSEERLVKDNVLPININDIMWDLALPIGVDRDHEYCNLTATGGSRVCDRIRMLGWKVIVTGCDEDPLNDRQMELVKIMKEKGVEVVSKFDEGDCHGIEVFDPSRGKALCVVIRNFISSSTNVG